MPGHLGQYVKLGFLVLLVDIPILSFDIPTLTDTFLIEWTRFQFLVNLVFIPISGFPDFDDISILKRKCESEGKFHFHP
jgi:hypothetical protein